MIADLVPSPVAPRSGDSVGSEPRCQVLGNLSLHAPDCRHFEPRETVIELVQRWRVRAERIRRVERAKPFASMFSDPESAKLWDEAAEELARAFQLGALEIKP